VSVAAIGAAIGGVAVSALVLGLILFFARLREVETEDLAAGDRDVELLPSAVYTGESFAETEMAECENALATEIPLTGVWTEE
jgi:hypothetical protein